MQRPAEGLGSPQTATSQTCSPALGTPQTRGSGSRHPGYDKVEFRSCHFTILKFTRGALRLLPGHSSTRCNRKEFAITDTELKLMAAAATMGLSNSPKNGYRTPAASGIPTEL